MISTTFAVLTDQAYFEKAKRTIEDLRSAGQWTGDIVLVAVGFTPSQNYIDYNRLTVMRVEPIDKSLLIKQLKEHPIKSMDDNRTFGKLTQWDKFYIFHEYFKNWKRVIYVDAGLRIFNPVHPLLDIEYQGSIVAPDDCGPYDNGNRFIVQLDLEANFQVNDRLIDNFGIDLFSEHYFLNCFWIYDTDILNKFTMQDLIDLMNLYPICRTNEMSIMNLLLNFKLGLWTPLPHKAENGKYNFGWSELNYRERPTWREFIAIKYPVTINFKNE